MNIKTKLLIFYIEQICEALEQDEMLFMRRIQLFRNRKQKSQEFLQAHQQWANSQEKTQKLVEEARQNICQQKPK
jgi:hypothetical protein